MCKMDLEEARRVLYTRVQSMDASNVLKIMGYLLILDIGEQEMLQLAISPDAVLQSFVSKAKHDLGLLVAAASKDVVPSSQHHQQQQQQQLHLQQQNGGCCIYGGISATTNAAAAPEEQEHQQQLSTSGTSLLHDQSLESNEDRGDYILPSPSTSTTVGTTSGTTPAYLNNLYDLLSIQQQQGRHNGTGTSTTGECSECYHGEHEGYHGLGLVNHGSYIRASSQASYETTATPVAPWKPCLYFARGYCKHGNGCRFLHAPNRTGSYSSLSDESQDGEGLGQASESLEHLEVELRDLLGGRRSPVSIASLPQLYYDRFGKTLQAEGYLTESQRHGKAGYSLTRLLAKLKGTVTLIDRPHGQHAIVLAEDAHKFMAYRGEGDDFGAGFVVNPSSRQIYLTFPAESGFSEEDVTTHFSAYGPVQDVRIPYQQKRMFGFVTFIYAETVRAILAEGNPHYICGARVLVKPYKEKGKLGDKRTAMEQQMKQLHRAFDRNHPYGLRYYLQDQALSKTITEEDLTAVLQQKLAQLQFASFQKRMTAPAVPNYMENNSLQLEQQLQKAADPEDVAQDCQPNPYGFVMDILDGDTALETNVAAAHDNEQQQQQLQGGSSTALPCNLQSDKKVLSLPMSGPSHPPSFFAHDIF